MHYHRINQSLAWTICEVVVFYKLIKLKFMNSCCILMLIEWILGPSYLVERNSLEKLSLMYLEI